MSTAPAKTTPHTGPLAPLRHRAFALLWTATLISNIGTWTHDVSAAWLMTSLSPSPLVVAMVQAATSGAMALFALPAGAMADLFDRKRLLLVLVTFKARSRYCSVFSHFSASSVFGVCSPLPSFSASALP